MWLANAAQYRTCVRVPKSYQISRVEDTGSILSPGIRPEERMTLVGSGACRWPASMGKNIVVDPAAKIESHPCGKEIKTCLGKVGTTFPGQHGVEPFFQGVEMKNVGGGVILLRLG